MLTSPKGACTTEDAIDQAISSQNQPSGRQLAAVHGIPSSTLGHRLRGRPDRSRGHAGQAALLEEEEEAIVVAIERLCDWHWAPSLSCMRFMAQDVLRDRAVQSQPNLGEHWPDRFLKRHPKLKITWTEALSNARAAAGLPVHIEHWMEKLQTYLSENHLRPSDLWNMDETGVQISGVHRKKVGLRRSRISFDCQRRAPGNRENVTLVECCSPDGRSILPLVTMHGTETQLD